MFIALTFLAYTLGLSDPYRLSFEKINPISLSLYAAICILFCNWSFRSKTISICVIILLLFIMVLSGSRGPLLALFLVTCSSIFFRIKFIKNICCIYNSSFILHYNHILRQSSRLYPHNLKV